MGAVYAHDPPYSHADEYYTYSGSYVDENTPRHHSFDPFDPLPPQWESLFA